MVTVMVLAAVATDAWAFRNDPGWFSDPGWPGGSGRRHVEFEFTNDVGNPNTHIGPGWDSSGGPDGDWTCDDVTWTQGVVQWYNAPPGWAGHQGVWGIDNTQGSGLLTGSMTFHINNFPDLNPEKWVWDELDYYASPGATISHLLAADPQQVGGVTPWVVSQQILNVNPLEVPPGFYENLDGVIKPNPYAENIIIDFFVPAGGEAYIDSLEFATWCNPEPGTMGLMAVGALGILRRRRRAS